MIDFEDAVKRIAARTTRLPVISVAVRNATGYYLASDIKTSSPIPRFDASAVDGYAIRTRDIVAASRDNPVMLSMSGTIRAGETAHAVLKPRHAIQILTGAPIPSGADAVVMQERVRRQGKAIVFSSPSRVGENIRSAGGEFAKGECVLKEGSLITPPVAGMLATLGITKVRVFRKPSVAVLVSGDELRPTSVRLRRGQIHDSNSYALASALSAVGIKPLWVRRVSDDRTNMLAVFRGALEKADVLISSGGVSVGEFDFVKDICRKSGIKKDFWRVAMKPGKPNFFGVKGKKLFFGLPGNPVAALLSFHLLVRPALERMMGSSSPSSFWFSARLQTSVRKKAGRTEFLRGVLNANAAGVLNVGPTRRQDSHMLGGLAAANCIICFPKASSELRAGDRVFVKMLNWSLL